MFPLPKKETIVFTLLAIAVIVVYFAGLCIDVTRDAAKYAYISKEIVETGNWLHPTILGEAYTQKPHLLFWLSAISFRIFGVSNIAFKLPVLLYSALGVWATFKLGTSIYTKQTGIKAAIILGFSVIMFLYNMDIHTDTVLQTNTAFALWLLHDYLKKNKLKYLIGAGAATGLAILSKGPFGVIVPLFAVTGYILFTRSYRKIWHWLVFALMAFVFSLPAWLNYYLQWGWEGIRFFLWTNTFGRVSGSYHSDTPDPTFFIHNTLYLFLPWTVLFFAGLFSQTKKMFRNQSTSGEHFLLWGFWVFFLLISISKSKVPNYLLSVVPIMAIFTAHYWQQTVCAIPKHKFTYTAQYITIAIAWFVLANVVILLFPVHSILFYAASTLLIVAFEIGIKQLSNEQKLWYRTLFTAVAIGLSLNLHVAPYLFGQQAQPIAAKAIAQINTAAIPIYNINYNGIEGKKARKKEIAENTALRNNPFAYDKHSNNFELMFYSKHWVHDTESFEQLDSLLSTGGFIAYTDELAYLHMVKRGTPIDSAMVFTHFDLRRTAKYINPYNRQQAIERKYVVIIPSISHQSSSLD